MRLVIYHEFCADGLTAAWVCLTAWQGAICVPCAYPNRGKLLPLLREHAPEPCPVMVVDFSFPRSEVEEALGLGYDIKLLDHHKTAQEDLQGLPDDVAVFDMNLSGAELAWKHFYPQLPPPLLVQYVADRDVWRHEMPNTREVSAYLQAISPSCPEDMGGLAFALADHKQFSGIVEQGRLLVTDFDRRVRSLTYRAFPVVCQGEQGVAVVAPHFYASDLGHALLDPTRFPGVRFALVLDICPGKGNSHGSLEIRGSFRSEDNLADVSRFAKALGGGGHRNAAGFKVPFEGQDLTSW